MSQITRCQPLNIVPFGLLPEDVQKEYCIEAKKKGMYEYYRSWALG